MKKKLLISISSLISLQFFSMFPEYFFSVSILYVLLAVIVATYNIYGLILQRALSESLTLTLLMTSYLVFNDDLLLLNFLNFNYSIVNDQLAFFTRILICAFSAFYFWVIASCIKEQKIISFEYSLIIFFAILGLLLMCNSNDFLIAYLSIELSTLAFYILSSFQKTSNSSTDTAVKYFVVGAVSSAFFLFGSSFIYGFTGSINFSEFSELLEKKYDWTYENRGAEFSYQNSSGLNIFFLKSGIGNTALFNETFEVLLSKYCFYLKKECFHENVNLFKSIENLFLLKHSKFNTFSLESVHKFWKDAISYVKFSYLAQKFEFKESSVDNILTFLKLSSNASEWKSRLIEKNSIQISLMEKLEQGSSFFDLKEFLNAYVKKCFYFSNKEFFMEQFKEILFTKTIVNYSLAKNFKEIFNSFAQDYCFYLKKDSNFMVKHLNYSFIEFGLILILFSLFIKLALAPFHTWLLDVYEGVPISSAFFFAVLTKLSIFVLLIRLCYSSFISLKSCWQFYSFGISLLSIFVGSFGGLKEKRLKTLLAYSSISHMGYALIAFSTSTSIGVQMLLFYVFVYMLSGFSIWYVIILLVLKKPKTESKSSKELGDLTLLNKSNLILSICLASSSFSVAGIPPLIGFFAKLNVFLAVVGDFFYVIGLIGIFCSVVSTFYYIRIIKVLYFENFLVGKLYYPIKTTKTVFLGILTFLLLFLFVNPTILYLIDYKAALHLL